jgi:hypothetical protein
VADDGVSAVNQRLVALNRVRDFDYYRSVLCEPDHIGAAELSFQIQRPYFWACATARVSSKDDRAAF